MKNEKDEIEGLKKMWPRPRVGQRVKLRGVKTVADVILVQGARDVLRSNGEVDAILLTQRARPVFGRHWVHVYYEADVILRGSVERVSAIDVEEILDPL